MSSTLLEYTRSCHEDIERLERRIVAEYKQDAKGHKERLTQTLRVKTMLDQLQDKARRLEEVYADEDNARKDEIAALAGDEPISTFQTRLREIRDYHRKFPAAEVTLGEVGEPEAKVDVRLDFTGEEASGRCLDLHAMHLRFINSKFGERKMEYLDYVGKFLDFSLIAKNMRSSQPYREYLRALLNYLESFHQRTQPLTPLERVYARLGDWEAKWAAGQVPGWEHVQKPAADDSTIDVEAFDTAEELETLGTERLKDVLQAKGLKSGGTLTQRAQRLFLTKDTPLHKLDRKHFAPGAAPAAALEPARAAALMEASKEAALTEAKVQALCSDMGTVLADTKANVEKKQARTYEEMVAEAAEAEAEAAPSDSDEEDEFVYNPLKLPLGYDGKPIPFWLYKLHGLNQEFECEICGDVKYRGRREFERHFKEWKHQNGMRALGIPNNKNFYEVTQIAEAKALWANIQDREKGGFNAPVEEEFEDEEGNVYNKKTYEDLRRQGII